VEEPCIAAQAVVGARIHSVYLFFCITVLNLVVNFLNYLLEIAAALTKLRDDWILVSRHCSIDWISDIISNFLLYI